MLIQLERAFQRKCIARFAVWASLLAIATLGPGKASAQGLVPTPSNCCGTFEVVNKGASPPSDELLMQDGSNFHEARSGGHLMDVWEGQGNTQVWMSVDNGKPFTFGGAATPVTPTVAAYGPDLFMVIFVGYDNHIWYAFVDQTTSHSNWAVVPIQTTSTQVSAVQMGANATNVFVTYHGEGSDDRIFQTWYDGESGSWANAGVIANGTSPSPPVVTYDPHNNSIYVFAQGLDNELFMTQQTLGAHSWATWKGLGVQSLGGPALAATSAGAIVTEVDDSTGFTLYLWAENGDFIEQMPDNGPVKTVISSVELTPVGSSVYVLYNSEGVGIYRLVYQP